MTKVDIISGFLGAGKTTFSRAICGLHKDCEGQFLWEGKPMDRKARLKRSYMVMQDVNHQLFTNSVLSEVLLSMEHPDEKAAEKILESLDLDEYKEKHPMALSGGQKQRVAIARALANDPKILISDESTSALDPKTTKQILALLQELNKKLGLTIVLITHEMQIVKDIANRVAVMQNGELIEEGSVLDIFSNPKNALTQDFITVATGIDEAMVKINQQAIVKNLPDDSILAHLKYAGSVTDTAIINDIYKQYQVSANILFGNIEILDNTPVGELVVILSGENENLETAKAELENAGVSVTIVKDGRKA